MSSAIPIIDISPLLTGGDEGLSKVAAEVGNACRGTGFFCIKGHGLEPGLKAEVFRQSAQFFALPDAVKRQTLFSATTGNRGYVPMKGEALDPTRPADLKEAFNIGLELAADDPDIAAGARFRALNLWPELPEFRPVMLSYFNAVWSIGRQLHRAFAHDLGVAEDYFEDKLDRPLAVLRLLHYPPRPAQVEAGQLGAGAHTDYGCITLLATDDAGGLEVQTRDGAWIKAPNVAGTLICNIGDCLMRWTNDIYSSTPHRVVNPPDRERYSVAFFLDPNPEAVVRCLPSIVEPARYPPITGADYLQSRLDATYKPAGLL
jgi:isopenicillin N synthase-like dioxygenase